MEQALSEVASSLQSSAPKQGPLHPWMTLAQIWLHAGTTPTLDPMGASAPPILSHDQQILSLLASAGTHSTV